MPTRRLTVDLRMYRHSGIGRYLRNLLPPLLPLLQADRIRVVAPSALVADAPWFAGPHRDPRLEHFATEAPIYSPAEQLLPFRGAFRDSTLLWVPHYNAPLLYGGRLAVTIHDLAPLALPELLGSRIKLAYAKLLFANATRRASAILTISQFTAGELERLLHVPREKITIAPLAADTHWPLTATAHHEPDGKPYFLYVGNVKPNKNLIHLLRAFEKVKDRLPHRLLLAGRMRGFGTGDEAVIRQAEALGDRIRFTDEISDAELIDLYAGASALVLPSLYEGFGLPVLEAMQLGCPVMASTAASLPEVGADAALYFDPLNVDSLAACLLQVEDTDLMQRLRTAGRAHAATFSYQRCAQTTAATLNPLLGGLRVHASAPLSD